MPWSEFGKIVAITEEETSVSTVLKEEDESTNKIFSVDGKLRSELHKGLNIVVQKNGRVRKVFIK